MPDAPPAVAYVVFRRKSWGHGSCRKYLARSRGGWTEKPDHAWFTTSHDEADEVAKALGLRVEARELLRPVAKFGEPQGAAIGKRVRDA